MIPGRGVSARIEGRHVLAGNLKMLEEDCGMPPASFLQAASEYLDRGCTLIWLALDGRAAGFLALSDTVRPESARMISRLKALGVQPCCSPEIMKTRPGPSRENLASATSAQTVCRKIS